MQVCVVLLRALPEVRDHDRRTHLQISTENTANHPALFGTHNCHMGRHYSCRVELQEDQPQGE